MHKVIDDNLRRLKKLVPFFHMMMNGEIISNFLVWICLSIEKIFFINFGLNLTVK